MANQTDDYSLKLVYRNEKNESMAQDGQRMSELSEKEYKHRMKLLVQLITSIVILVGIVGNSLNIIIFGRPNMRKSSTFRFLIYLSICDMLVLLVCATEAIVRFGFEFEIRSYSNLTCRMHTFLTYLLIHSSSTILMIVSVDRALRVMNTSLCRLLRCRKQNDVNYDKANAGKNRLRLFGSSFMRKFNRTDLTVAVTLVFLLLLNSHYILNLKLNLKEGSLLNNIQIYGVKNQMDYYMYNTSYDLNKIEHDVEPKEDEMLQDDHGQMVSSNFVCFPQKDQSYRLFLTHYWNLIDISVYAFIPFIVMSVCSIIIVIKARSKNLKYINNLVTNPNSEFNKSNLSRRMRKNRQLQYMLITTNLYFIFSQLPYCVTFVVYMDKYDENLTFQSLVHTLSYSNNAINFIFYCLSSEMYRKELLKIALHFLPST